MCLISRCLVIVMHTIYSDNTPKVRGGGGGGGVGGNQVT